ncbi:transglycosylase domain-containing protein [Candidatus Peregrinibacteria bacterium]|nr:transglycosylase domain-containing protein [Candidatus Peregrinibacteria bacterium]
MKFGRELKEKLHHHIAAAMPALHEPFWKRAFAWLILGSVTFILAGLFLFTVTVAFLSIGLPDVRNFDKLAGVESTIILDREGGILYTIHGEENRKYVPLSEISPFLQKATIAIEDDEFYEHSGFDIPGIAKGILYEVFGIGTRRGGSTITQQLAKNAFLSAKRSYLRKLKELILAIRLERAYDKNKILELYLNRIPYGNNAYGAELASKMYFGKSASSITLGEAAILASLPKAPTYYSPYGPNAYSKLERELNPAKLAAGNFPKTVTDISDRDYTIGLVGRDITFSETDRLYIPGRADLVLKRMEELDLISEEEKAAATNEIQHIDFQKYKERIRAAHFVFYVRSLLEEQFGKDLIEQGGLQVYTTLDPNLQAAAEDIVAQQIEKSKEQHGVTNAALFAMSAKTGEVLAMVGAADYFDEEARGNVNHVFAKRQPGSSFKPIVYAQAFTKGYAPATVIYDTPTNFGSNYKPQNFEGGFKGPMPIRQALGQSRNIPALKTYFLAGEEGEIVGLANKMGISTLSPNGNYGPPLAIGAGEVKLSEMVQAFSVFANSGVKRDFYSILKVVDREGDVIYERKPEDHPDQPVLDPQAAYLVNSILSDKSVYLGGYLDVAGHTTAAKTGTSNKEITPVKILPSNLWTVGYTPSLVAGVWAGNSDGAAAKGNADGYNVAAPVWSKFMTEALKNQPDESFPVPDGIKHVKVSRASGKLPTPDTPEYATATDVFASFSVPTELDDIYKMIEVNKLDNLLPNEFTPKEQIEKKLFMNHRDPITDYGRWLSGIKEWLAKKRTEEPTYPDFPPTETTKIFTAETAKNPPQITIISPAAFSTIDGRDIQVEVDVEAKNGIDRVIFSFDDRNLPSSVQRKPPYTGKVHFPKSTKTGTHMITAKLFDKVGYVADAKVEFQYEKD